MLDHIGFPVTDFARSKAFYAAALAPLRFSLIMEYTDPQSGQAHAGFGRPGRPQFWIGSGTPLKGVLHVALIAEDRGAVRAFHEAALNAGGRDNGAPSLRPHYHASYFAAFVLDPDGHNVEAVCHFPGDFQDQFTGPDGQPKPPA